MKRQMSKDNVQDISDSFMGLAGIRITSVEKSEEKVVIKAETGTKPKECSSCGSKTMWRHSSTKATIHHVPIDGRPCEIALTRLRWRCPVCGYCFQGALPECVGEKTYTKQLVEYLNEKCLTSKFKDLEKAAGISDSSLQRYAVKRIKELEKKYHFPLAGKIGFVEINVGGQLRMAIMNLDKKTLIELRPTPEQSDLIKFLENKYTEEERKRVIWICTDTLSSFNVQISSLFPNARWVVDKKYVLLEANLALETVIKTVGDKSPKNAKKILRKNSKKALLQHQDDPKLSQELRTSLETELAVIQATLPESWTAYCLKEELFNIFEKSTVREEAEKGFDIWTQSIPDLDVYEKFRTLSKTVNKNREAIFNYWDFCDFSKVFNECVDDLLKATKRVGRGQTFETLRGRILYNKRAVEAPELGSVVYGPSLAVLCGV